jgi:hypothetical protein
VRVLERGFGSREARRRGGSQVGQFGSVVFVRWAGLGGVAWVLPSRSIGVPCSNIFISFWKIALLQRMYSGGVKNGKVIG